MRYASREKVMKICLRRCAGRRRRASICPHSVFVVQTILRPAVTGGGAMFVGMRILEK